MPPTTSSLATSPRGSSKNAPTTVVESSARATAVKSSNCNGKPSVNSLEYEHIPSAVPYCGVFFPIIVSFLDYYGYLGPITNFGCLFYFFVVLSAVDTFFGFDFSNPSPKIYAELERAVGFRVVTWLFVPAQLFHMFWALTIALPSIYSRMDADAAKADDKYNFFFPMHYWGLLLNVGATQAFAILTAHELIHKLNFVEHWLGNILLINSSFPEYCIEHIQVHHKLVGLKSDPTCAREEENYYVYVFRNVPTYIINAFKVDFKKSALLFSLCAIVDIFIIPRRFLGFFLATGLIGKLFLLAGDYIEHWGLAGFRLEGEPITPMVSWSDSSYATSHSVLRVNVHAMHHQKGGLRYQSLRSHAYSPQLPPFGYAGMILLALIPPLWFRVMTPRLEKAKAVMKELRESGKIHEVFTEEYLKEHSFNEDFHKIGWF